MVYPYESMLGAPAGYIDAAKGVLHTSRRSQAHNKWRQLHVVEKKGVSAFFEAVLREFNHCM